MPDPTAIYFLHQKICSRVRVLTEEFECKVKILEQMQLNPYTVLNGSKLRVLVSPFHAAKGLEFPVIFITDAKDILLLMAIDRPV